MAYFIDVIVPLPLKNTFTYALTTEEFANIAEGMRVAVPFGKTKVYTGVVLSKHTTPPLKYEAKPIEEILDSNPTVTPKQLKFWVWMASYYMCSLGEVLKASLPSAFLLESETVVELNKAANIDFSELDDNEFLIVEALQNQSLLRIQEIMQILDKQRVLPILNRLVDKQAVIINQEIYEQYKPKVVSYVRLNTIYKQDDKLHDLLDELSRAPKQREVIFKLFETSASEKKLQASDLAKLCNTSSSVIKSLVDKGILESYQIQEDRVQFEGESTLKDITFNAHQLKAYNSIQQSFETNSVCLLHGVTSSGKTEIYINLIKDVLAKGEQVLYLVPEIALTTQLITRLQSYFGEEVLIYHSKYSVNERVEVYNHVKNKSKGKIIIGARSSIFLPFQELGLIIVDEEHESTFKQYDPAPRYNARDAAVVLANLFKTRVLLGSATPSIESYYNAKHQKYGFVSLNKRFGDVLPPEIELVNIKEKYKRKEMNGHFSDRLAEEILNTLKQGEQVILFQNRRGYSPYLECLTCGESPQCPNCDVSLTYHSYKNQLRCHYCGYHIAMQLECMKCGSADLTTKGLGTEQVETELKALYPDHNIGRMDLDTTRGKHGYEKIITAFENKEIDILVGTQMLSKGLDFRNVGLVGVMNADSLLNFPDFRAHERSFQMLQQVAGRAGRTKKRGRVLIQTYNPFHQILQQVSTNDYVGMYKDQIEERHQYKYPPLCRLIRFTFRNKDFNKVNEASLWFAKSMANTFKEHVLGPEFPPVSRIRNEYYKNVILKIPKQQSLSKTKEVIDKILKSYTAIGQYRGVRCVINVDPY
jgi:primosomal protein N' (replication factor Y)